MFMQLVLGKVSDVESVRREWDRWMSDLAPGAAGWLGSTGGVTADGRLLMSTCFATAEAAATNARRPEQAAGYRVWSGDAVLVALDYFSSEADARAGEVKAVPDDLAAGFQEWQSLLVAPEWYDITDPWLRAPE